MTAPQRLQRPVAHLMREGRHNLPTSLSSFVGRESEQADLLARLAGARLVTLTGVGGCGKTRLALEVARAVLDRYADGVWLVELAALADAALVPQTVAAVFNMRESGGSTDRHCPCHDLAWTKSAASYGQLRALDRGTL